MQRIHAFLLWLWLSISEATTAEEGNTRGAAGTLALNDEAFELSRSTVIAGLGRLGIPWNVGGEVRAKFCGLTGNRDG